jgi:eukaryotic-like serine/threonine-protein kinase
MHVYPSIDQVVGGKYRVVRTLGEGGTGVVLEAVNIATGKRVALKWMHPHVSADPVAVERLRREAQLAARIRHPNVIDIYDVDHHESALFLVMEYLEGESLRVLLERGIASSAELLSLLLGAMRGAAAAHKRGVIHRDVKPENIFLALEGSDGIVTPKLVDFGISKLALLDTSQVPLTRAGAMFGTPLYMSYEQLSGAPLDQRTDIYSFGVVLYELLTGRVPHEADGFAAIIVRIASQDVTPLRDLAPHVPPALERAVSCALSRDREKRMSSMDELIAAVEPFVGDPALRKSVPRVTVRRTTSTADPHTPVRPSQATSSVAAKPIGRTYRQLRLTAALTFFVALTIAGTSALLGGDANGLGRSPPKLPAPALPAAAHDAPRAATAVEGPAHLPPSAAPARLEGANLTEVDASAGQGTRPVPPRAQLPSGKLAPLLPRPAPPRAAPSASAPTKQAPAAAPARGADRRVETPRLSEF